MAAARLADDGELEEAGMLTTAGAEGALAAGAAA
jgi:hypothetical protein